MTIEMPHVRACLRLVLSLAALVSPLADAADPYTPLDNVPVSADYTVGPGDEVVVNGRDKARTESTASEIAKATGANPAQGEASSTASICSGVRGS